MVQLDEVAVFAKNVKLELSLECEDRQKVVKPFHLVTSEYQLMLFEQVVSMLIDIHLQGRVERMLGKGVMIGESDDVVSEPFKSFMYFCC